MKKYTLEDLNDQILNLLILKRFLFTFIFSFISPIIVVK